MTNENIIFAVICWLCSLIFVVIALWAFKRKDPMNFWSGSTVRPEDITDIPAYNRANGLMWAIYAFCMVVAGFVSLFSVITGGILLVIICVPGITALIIVYNRIYNKYKSTSVTYKTHDSKTKTPKAVIITVISIAVMIFIALGAMFYCGEKDPDVNIFDDHIQISAMYGLDIDFSEIADISLIDKSMKDIGVGMRTNGYGGIGGTLKGNFKSDDIGETLLFVQSKSSPTIKIERIGRKEVYVSFKNSESTEKLYHELIEKIPLNEP